MGPQPHHPHSASLASVRCAQSLLFRDALRERPCRVSGTGHGGRPLAGPYLPGPGPPLLQAPCLVGGMRCARQARAGRFSRGPLLRWRHSEREEGRYKASGAKQRERRTGRDPRKGERRERNRQQHREREKQTQRGTSPGERDRRAQGGTETMRQRQTRDIHRR